MESLGFTAIPAITVICYLIDKMGLPIICGISGAVLGSAAMRILPEYGANDPLTAIAIGIVSGLAATGVNQIVKQLGQK